MPINAKKVAALSDTVIEYKADKRKIRCDRVYWHYLRLLRSSSQPNARLQRLRYHSTLHGIPTSVLRPSGVDQMAAIWASDDPKAAMHNAKVERKMPASSKDLEEKKQIIAKQYQLGRELGINGILLQS